MPIYTLVKLIKAYDIIVRGIPCASDDIIESSKMMSSNLQNSVWLLVLKLVNKWYFGQKSFL